MAKFVWEETKFVLSESHEIKANDLKKITMVIDENADIIIRRWKEYFDNRKEG